MKQDEMKLLPCPFHAPEINRSEVVGEWFSGTRIVYWSVFCEACGAHGPEEESREEAIGAWNTRAAQQRVTQLEAALRNIASQRLRSEIEPVDGEVTGDFEGAYDTMINVARAALTGASVLSDKEKARRARMVLDNDYTDAAVTGTSEQENRNETKAS